MKKTILTLTAATAFLLASCGNNAKNAEATTSDSNATENVQEAAPEAEATVVGTWKLSDIDLGMEVPKGKEKVMEEMKQKMIAETVYTFNEDGTMTFKNPMAEAMPATYVLEGSKLTVTNDKDKKEDTFTVEELTADKLVLSSEQRGKKAVMTFSK